MQCHLKFYFPMVQCDRCEHVQAVHESIVGSMCYSLFVWWFFVRMSTASAYGKCCRSLKGNVTLLPS